MRKTAAILTLVGLISMLGTSDVRAGAALVPAGKTTGPALTATVVIDVTQGGSSKGETTIRVQKASTSAAVTFDSGYVSTITFLPGSCVSNGFFDLLSSTVFRFVGWYIDGIIDDPVALQALLGTFGNPSKATITNVDYVACTTASYPTSPPARQILSFTAVIGFTK